MLIPASVRYDQELLDKIGHYDLSRLTEYKPEYLSGYIAARYSVSHSDGWKRAKSRIDGDLGSQITRQIGGDEVKGLTVRTRYSARTYKHMLLPIWNAVYTFKRKQYRFMVNGQTGLLSGTVPRSPWKIFRFVLFWLIVLGLVGYGIYLANNDTARIILKWKLSFWWWDLDYRWWKFKREWLS